MNLRSTISVPTLLRIKPGALDRLGIYLRRFERRRAALLLSEGLPQALVRRLQDSLAQEGVSAVELFEISEASFEEAQRVFAALPSGVDAVVGFGGGKALDVAKYVGHLSRQPYFAVPASLSNDGFCSPQASLTLAGRRRSLRCELPYGVAIDTEVCLAAPEVLWLSGVGDLVAKVTAIADWKLAFYATGEPIDDFAALLSDATVFQFMARPTRDLEGLRLLGTALLLNGVAMELCGSSRPASGSEHLISHALDGLTARPRLHGLQVGVATYLVSLLQQQQSQRVAQVLDQTGFWGAVQADPFDRAEWIEAVKRAPAIKPDRYTVLSSRDCTAEVERLLREDPRLAPCFRGQ